MESYFLIKSFKFAMQSRNIKRYAIKKYFAFLTVSAASYPWPADLLLVSYLSDNFYVIAGVFSFCRQWLYTVYIFLYLGCF